MENKHFKQLLLGIAAIAIIVLFIPRNSVFNAPPKNDMIIAFGDSLVRGVGSSPQNDFVSVLSRKLGKQIENRGVPGETTSDALKRLNDIVQRDPGTVIILLGGNDTLQKVPRTETFKNLRTIVERLQSSGSMVVLLGVRGGIFTDPFEGDFKILARERHLIYVPDVLDGLFGNSQFMSDAVHPNDLGYARIADRVYSSIHTFVE